jgi:transcriptional regulator with XRE-family HTH domain
VERKAEPAGIGPVIRLLRKRKPRRNGRQGWTLEDLAAAAGTDAAHLSRIERGHVRPSSEVLVRISQALDLARPEMNMLLVAAGYAARNPEPDVESVARAIAEAEALTATYHTPVALVTAGFRIHWMNRSMMLLYRTDPVDFAQRIRGRLSVELIFVNTRERPAPPRSTRNGLLPAERHVRLYRTGLETGTIERDESLLERLMANPLFYEYWERAGEFEAPAVEQEQLLFDHPVWGPVTFDSWWSPLSKDRRFWVILLIPHDAATRAVVRRREADDPVGASPLPVGEG